MKMNAFQENVDSWIKQINSEFSGIKGCSTNISENTSNINFNYELIKDLKEEVESLKNEIKALTMLQIAHLKKKV